MNFPSKRLLLNGNTNYYLITDKLQLNNVNRCVALFSVGRGE